MFLDGDVGEMDEHVVQLAGAGRVLDCAKAAEPQLVPKQESPLVQRTGEERTHSLALFS